MIRPGPRFWNDGADNLSAPTVLEKAIMPKAIIDIEQHTYTDEDWPYRIEVYCIPPGPTANVRVRDRFDNRMIDLPMDFGSIWFEVFDPSGGWAGSATFAGGDGAVQCDLIQIEPAHRCRGIATILYQIASSTFEAPVIPSATQSYEAKAFWAGRSQISYP